MRTFDDIFSWRRHVKIQHGRSVDFDTMLRQQSPTRLFDWDANTAMAADDEEYERNTEERAIGIVERSAVDFVLGLRSSSSVTIATCEKAVQVSNLSSFV